MPEQPLARGQPFAMLKLGVGNSRIRAHGDRSLAAHEEARTVKALAVQVFMKPEHREAFIEEMLKDAVGSERNEPGCLMFNVAQDEADPNVLHLFEVYADGDAVDAHTKTPHFLGWVEATKDWQTKPFAISKCETVYPPDTTWKKRPAP